MVPLAQGQTACVPPTGATAHVVRIEDRGELVLDDQRIVAIAGLDIPSDPETRGAVRAALSDWLTGHAVQIRPVSATEDRWGRTIADIAAPVDFSADAESPPVSVAAVLVEAGLARVRPNVPADPCVSALLAAEDEARRNRLGLWSDPYYSVLDAGNLVALAAHNGRFTLVEGQVTHVGIGRSRLYVDFGRGRDAFTVVATKRVAKTFARAGFSLETLSGARLRVRGVLNTRDGPRIEIAGPADAERL